MGTDARTPGGAIRPAGEREHNARLNGGSSHPTTTIHVDRSARGRRTPFCGPAKRTRQQGRRRGASFKHKARVRLQWAGRAAGTWTAQRVQSLPERNGVLCPPGTHAFRGFFLRAWRAAMAPISRRADWTSRPLTALQRRMDAAALPVEATRLGYAFVSSRTQPWAAFSRWPPKS